MFLKITISGEEDAIKKEGDLLLTYIVCPFGYIKGVFAQSAHIKIRLSKKVTRPRQLSIKVIFRRKAWMVFALRTCGFGYAGLEKSYRIMNMRRPMKVVNLDKIKDNSTNNAAAELQKESQEVVDTATLFRIKQALKVFSHMQFKRFDEENKENYLGRVKKIWR